jgi:NADH dehydrogenase
MNVLVTGASGFIGQPLVRTLLAHGHRVRALVRRAGEMTLLPGADVEVGDLRDSGAVERAARGMDAIVHLAWATGVARESSARAVNVEGTRRLVDAARVHGARRFVFVSSISAARERMGPYGRTKLEAERLVAGSGLEWVILRPSLVYGPGPAGLFARLERSLRGPVVPIVGDGSIELDPIHVEDVCAVIEQCLVRADSMGKRYDLLGPERVTFRELLVRLAAAIDARPRFVAIPAGLALSLARLLGAVMERPPLSEDNVLGMISPAAVDGGVARREFPIAWTSLSEGLRSLGRAVQPA